jgi:putative ABC transport system permease protein
MTPRSHSIASACYGLLQLLLPARFRERYGAEMRQVFEDEWRHALLRHRIRMTMRAPLGIVVAAVALRLSRNPTTSGAHDTNWNGLGIDARAAWRGLTRRPAFTLTAVFTIALGIGAATAMFSVIDATVFRALHVPDANRLLWLWGTFQRSGNTEFLISAAEFTDLRTDVRSFDRVGGWSTGEVLIDPHDERPARTVSAANTVGDIYPLVGARVQLGRLPNAHDDVVGAGVVGVITDRLWRTEFAADPRVLAMHVMSGPRQVHIVGVLAPNVALPGQTSDVWIHRVLDPTTWVTNRSGHGLNAIARLRPGVSQAAARAELTRRQAEWAVRYAGQHSFGIDGHGVNVARLSDKLLGESKRVALLLAVMAGLLLVLACANVANLFLARGETRVAETGVRLALGASGRRIAQPVLLEGTIIAGAGSALGVAVAAVGLPLLLSLAPAELIREAVVVIDARTVTFAIAIAAVTALLFAGFPASSATRRDAAALIRTGASNKSTSLRGLRILVAGQAALAAVLLVAAGLFVRSLAAVNAVDPGIDPRGRVSIVVMVPPSRYPTPAAFAAFDDALVDRVAALPGVERAAMVRSLPVRDGTRIENVVPEFAGDDRAVSTAIQIATVGVLRTLGARLIAGRDLGDQDQAGAPHAVVINQSAARALWPGENAVGKRIVAKFLPDSVGYHTVVGVYADIRAPGLTPTPTPEVVFPAEQSTSWAFAGMMRRMSLVVQSGQRSDAALHMIAGAIGEIDPLVPLELPTTMDAVVRSAAARERFLAALLSILGTMALVIAVVGVYGVVSFAVAQQTRELAIRSALGGGRLEIVRRVLWHNAGVAMAGAFAGSIAAAVASPLMRAMLYHASLLDPVVFLTVPCALTIIAILASLLPTGRVARLSLVELLRG